MKKKMNLSSLFLINNSVFHASVRLHLIVMKIIMFSARYGGEAVSNILFSFVFTGNDKYTIVAFWGKNKYISGKDLYSPLERNLMDWIVTKFDVRRDGQDLARDVSDPGTNLIFYDTLSRGPDSRRGNIDWEYKIVRYAVLYNESTVSCSCKSNLKYLQFCAYLIFLTH